MLTMLSLHVIMKNTKAVVVASKEFGKRKGLPQQAEVAQGVPGKLCPRIFLAFGTTRVVGRQP
jgi:hypothetical protein